MSLRRTLSGFASTTSSAAAFPFPTHPRPTAHQIFHLSPNATCKEIKARCNENHSRPLTLLNFFRPDYDLVRVHHPDSSHCKLLPHSERQSRFQAITAAYETLLRGSLAGPPPNSWRPSGAARTPRRYTGYQNDRTYSYPNTASWNYNTDESWKDWLIVITGVFVRSRPPSSFLFRCCTPQCTDFGCRSLTGFVPLPICA